MSEGDPAPVTPRDPVQNPTAGKLPAGVGAALLAGQICAGPVLRADPALAASPPVLGLIAALIDQGSLAFDGED